MFTINYGQTEISDDNPLKDINFEDWEKAKEQAILLREESEQVEIIDEKGNWLWRYKRHSQEEFNSEFVDENGELKAR